jgi:AraC-like DNA-binding protein
VATGTKPMISLAAATGLIEAIEAAGANPDHVLKAVGVDREVLSDPQGFIPFVDFARILEGAAHATGDDCFGLHFGERFHPKNIGPLVYVVLHSPTMMVGFENVARYLRVHNEAVKVSFAMAEKWAYLRSVRADLPVEIHRQQQEYSMAVGLGTIRLMAGTEWVPVEVQFEHEPPSHTSEQARVFGAPVSFGCAANVLVVEREFCERQVPASDARLYPILRQYLDRILDEMPREDELLASVRRAIGECMRHGDPALTQVAGTIAMGPRTLQRRLKDHGADFKGLINDTRRRFSLAYLRDRKNTLTEIAYLLGYAEVSAFNRAFKRWTGSTPSDYRRGLISGRFG